ncbi:protein KASH5 isoform X2 [Ornithorhynchus anatinus]|uniref:protein KASH5 isoform X2 n=1 Tax=Ornithorhynchus anatinus TaxID=9258 RepID=UPI0019D4DE58|nr:protein KASH5 isoform X2 [Ornithorhynchus anatinus]
MSQPNHWTSVQSAEQHLDEMEPPPDMIPRDWPCDALGRPVSLEEQVLISTFRACDLEKTGKVPVAQILTYIEAVSGQGAGDDRLQSLANQLDPEQKGASVDFGTFLAITKDWISYCQQDRGPEHAEEAEEGATVSTDLLPSGTLNHSDIAQLESYGGEDLRSAFSNEAELRSSIEDLEFNNRRLVGENEKLQRAVEVAEEIGARLGEEISTLEKKLRSSQQALQVAKARDEELEDMKSLAKSLQEENRGLQAQARHSNGKLLAEHEGVKMRSEVLAAERMALKRQLCEYETLICHRDSILSERTSQTEDLTEAVEQYRATIQELKSEIGHLEEKLFLSQGGEESRTRDPPEAGESAPQSMFLEIEATQMSLDPELELPSPLCGALPGEMPSKPAKAGDCREEELSLERGDQEGRTASYLEAVGPEETRRDTESPALTAALVPVQNQLAPMRRRTWKQLHPIPQPAPDHRASPQPPLLGLLLLFLMLLSLLLLSLPGLPAPGPPRRPAWPHLQLHYLQPPPV